MINVVLLTGFLGSGKTTLMQNLLDAFKDKKTGVIVNEFGSVNIDAMILKKEGISVAELSNGSIFCACIKDKFVDSLIEMARLDIDYLFIEASGLADPANMTTILQGIAHLTHDNYGYRGSICVLDGESFMELCEVLPAITSQVEFCSDVIINKEDLIEEEDKTEIREKIKDINSGAVIHEASYCKVDIRKIVENMGLKITHVAARESSNTNANRATTVIVKGTKNVPMEGLKAFIDEVIGDSYRIKGFAETDCGPVEISTVGKNISITPWDKLVDKNEIVVISSVGFKIMSTVTRAIKNNLDGIMTV